MKKYLMPLFFMLNFILSAQNKIIYVSVDYKYHKLFKLSKELDKKDNTYFATIKILKNDKKNIGFNKKEIKNNSNGVIEVTKQPAETNYYTFESYKKPKKIENINNLKIYTIQDISKNIIDIQKIWTNSNYSIIFIEKSNCDYNLWDMKPIHIE